MPKILVLYGTTDGHTGEVARFIGNQLLSLGAEVEVVDARGGNPDPVRFDGVVVAASIHIGGYQRCVVDWVRARAEALKLRKTAFVSVCLGILQKDLEVHSELAAIKTRFTARTGWEPDYFKIVAGALPYTRYRWWKRIVMRRIARKTGGATDTSRDHDYTDWVDLQRFARTFESICAPEPELEPEPRKVCRKGSACRCETATIPD